MKLLRQRVAVVMLGRDIGKGLVALLKKLCPEDVPADIVIGRVCDWRDSEIAKLTSQDDEGKIARVSDRAECLLALLDGSVTSAAHLERVLTHLFSRSEGQVMLSSIHRFKGKEADYVIHLDPWRMPSRRSLALARAGDRRELEQERNLNYVCETRTRHTFVQANLEDYAA
jgi:superfamily I DNA/RNA helicase